MRTKTALTVIGATAALGAGGAAATGAAASGTPTNSASSSSVAARAATRHVEGRVVAVSSPARTFTVRDRERGTVTLKVTVRTRFDRIAGFSALRTGKSVDVRAVRSNAGLLATKVEPLGPRIRSLHTSRRAGVWHAVTRGDDPVGHDVGDDRGQDLAGPDVGDDRGNGVAGEDRGDHRGGQPGRDDGPGHDRGDDHGGHGRH